MAAKILYIFQHECLGAFFFQNPTHIKKKRTLCFIFKSCCSSQTLFFRNTGNRERLAGKACYQNVVIGNICGIYFRNIAIRIFAKIGKIGFLTIPVPLV